MGIYKLGVLGSGKGSNFVSIAEACSSGAIRAKIALVISDAGDAGILSRAAEQDIPRVHIPPGKFRTRLDDSSEVAYVSALRGAGVDLVVLAGFMRVLKSGFLHAFQNRIVNIHPSLLPSFPGLEAWRQAFDYGVRVTGCTVHMVDAGIDAGPILGQQAVPVMDGDTPETLHARIQAAEHELYPRCVAALAEERVAIIGRRIIWNQS